MAFQISIQFSYETNLEESSYQSTRTDNYWHATCIINEINIKLLHVLISYWFSRAHVVCKIIRPTRSRNGIEIRGLRPYQ